jgi:hypothetical protein
MIAEEDETIRERAKKLIGKALDRIRPRPKTKPNVKLDPEGSACEGCLWLQPGHCKTAERGE